MKIWERDACLWAQIVDVRLFVRWKYGCMRSYMCDACLWAEIVDMRLFVRWKYGYMRTYMCDACLWAENVDMRLFVRRKYGCMRTHMCDACLWTENVDVRLFVRWKYGFMRTYMCDACMWAEHVYLWRLFVDENVVVVVIGRGRQCSLYKRVSILKLETALRYLHTRHHGVPFWLWWDLKSACSPVTVHSYSS
jgi:hypothetical protein